MEGHGGGGIEPMTTSRNVGEVFGKEHGKVIRDIEKLECSQQFSQANFGLTSYRDSFNREQPCYELTRDGFTFLAMGRDIWFVAKDVCDVLGLVNPSMAIQSLDEDERAKQNLGRQGDTWIISESGLYALIGGTGGSTSWGCRSAGGQAAKIAGGLPIKKGE